MVSDPASAGTPLATLAMIPWRLASAIAAPPALPVQAFQAGRSTGCTGRECRVRSRRRRVAGARVRRRPEDQGRTACRPCPVLTAAGDSGPRRANFPGRGARVLYRRRCPRAGSARRDGARDERGRDAELLAHHSAARQGVARTPGWGLVARRFSGDAGQRYRESRASGTGDHSSTGPGR